MNESARIKHWLALLANARLAVGKAIAGPTADDVGVDYELRRAGELLEQAFLSGLDAHGQAVVKEYLESNTALTA